MGTSPAADRPGPRRPSPSPPGRHRVRGISRPQLQVVVGPPMSATKTSSTDNWGDKRPAGSVGPWRPGGGCSSAGWAVTSGRASPGSSKTSRGWARSRESTSIRPGGGSTAPTSTDLARRPRPHRRDGDQVRPARPRAHLRSGSRTPGPTRSGPPAHRRRGDLDPRRGGRVPVAGVDRRAQRHRDLRPGARVAHTARRIGRLDPTSGFGKMLAGIELTAATIGRASGWPSGRCGSPP